MTITPDIDAMFTIDPPPWASIARGLGLADKRTPVWRSSALHTETTATVDAYQKGKNQPQS